MPRVRKRDKHLPPCVHFKNGAYYYVKKIDTKKRQWIWLGRTFQDAMKAWVEIVKLDSTPIMTMNQLLDRYMIEVAPHKADKTYKGNLDEVKKLRTYFGDMSPIDVKPTEVYDFLHLTKAKVAANRAKSLLSHCFTKAIEWGIVPSNPCAGVRRNKEKPRNRYINDEEYKSARKRATPFLKHMMNFAYLTGQRKEDILKIELSDIDSTGIKIRQGKTGAYLLIEWDHVGKLERCIKEIREMRGYTKGKTLFRTKKGLRYSVSGFDSMWQRFIKSLIKAGIVDKNNRYTFNDFRAKSATDDESIEEASDRLGHTNSHITRRVYDRKIKKVRVLKRKVVDGKYT